MHSELLIQARDVTKTYQTGALEVPALRGISVDILAGDFLTIVGPSGSGKTTFLNLVGALDSPTSGEMHVFGQDIAALTKRARSDLRLGSLGFVFQAYNLVPVLTARENVEFVLELQGLGREQRRQRAEEVLAQLGLDDLADRRPNELSGGQQQRVAVARAIAAQPTLVLADEPTANLDSRTGSELVEMMHDLNEQQGVTFLFSSHDPKVIKKARRVVELQDGEVLTDNGEEG